MRPHARAPRLTRLYLEAKALPALPSCLSILTFFGPSLNACSTLAGRYNRFSTMAANPNTRHCSKCDAAVLGDPAQPAITCRASRITRTSTFSTAPTHARMRKL